MYRSFYVTRDCFLEELAFRVGIEDQRALDRYECKGIQGGGAVLRITGDRPPDQHLSPGSLLQL